MTIEPSLLQVLWTEIEIMPNHVVSSLSDAALRATLLNQVSEERRLSGEERHQLSTYLSVKLSLIRDMADCRSVGHFRVATC